MCQGVWSWKLRAFDFTAAKKNEEVAVQTVKMVRDADAQLAWQMMQEDAVLQLPVRNKQSM